MAFAISTKSIHCPNCAYEGKAKIQGSGCGWWLLWLVSLLCGILFFSLIIPPIICGLMFLWLALKPAGQVCRVCGNSNVIPLSHWRKMRRSRGSGS